MLKSHSTIQATIRAAQLELWSLRPIGAKQQTHQTHRSHSMDAPWYWQATRNKLMLATLRLDFCCSGKVLPVNSLWYSAEVLHCHMSQYLS